ncbi:hypothetical protein PoB_005070100 [Plakobranchus ocellatus]|uniref:Nose resistant-to-fluoxetine protein N-terminal domain-containing protein n=1 Tax=Plakobranchus ocellatus TaxID=259542 RepID=A0AAV4BYK4_9GAST|nr:hypothetical protein PoB_005070100 [Plakobranchus ocellatus]
MISDQGKWLKDLVLSSLNVSLVEEIPINLRSGLSDSFMNSTIISSIRSANLIRSKVTVLRPWVQNISSFKNSASSEGDLDRLTSFWQFQGLDRVRNLIELLARGGSMNSSTRTTKHPSSLATDVSKDKTPNPTTESRTATSRSAGTTITMTSTTLTSTRATVTKIPTTKTATLSTPSITTTQFPTPTTTLNLTTQSATTESKAYTSPSSKKESTSTILPMTTTTTITTRDSPFFDTWQRFRESRNNLQETVSNATERLAQLVREEIRNTELAQLLYTLLNSDLVRAIFEALDISYNLLQTTPMTTPEITFLTNITEASLKNGDTVERFSSSLNPSVQAMAQTAIQVLQTANLSDPVSIVSTASQVVLDNARQTIRDEILSDPLVFIKDTADFLTRNNSFLSRIIPQGTLLSISSNVESALQGTQFAISLAQIYSTSSSYATSQRCTAERGSVVTGITQLQPWALTFLDSIGKPGTGFLQGNTWLEGNYDQCKAIHETLDNDDIIEGHFVKYIFRIQIPGFDTSFSPVVSLRAISTMKKIKYVRLHGSMKVSGPL